jgi:CAAX protease family protein
MLHVVQRLAGWLTRQRVPVRALRIDDPTSEARTWLGFAIGYFFVSILIGWVIGNWPHPFLGAASLTQDAAYIFVFKLLLLLAVPLAMYRRMGYRIADLSAWWRPTVRSLLIVGGSYAAGFLINASHIRLISEARSSLSGLEFAGRVGIGIVLPFLMAGFPEELVYRGLLQTRLEAVRSRATAILATALLFTAWHIPPRYFASHGVEGQAGDLTSVLIGTGAPVFIVALIFGLVWDRYRSFWPLVACHTGIDTLPIISSMLGIDR